MRLVSIDNVLWSGTHGGAIFSATAEDGSRHRIVASPEVLHRPPVCGEIWQIEGVRRRHPEYGLQVEASKAVLQRPSGRLIMNMIAKSRKFAGLGETKARQLWEAFGDGLYAKLDAGDPTPFVPVVGEQLAAVLLEAWTEVAGEAVVFGWLDRHGASVSLATKLLAIYGSETTGKLEENPYRILAFTGWQAADALARTMGVAPDDERRLVAAADAVVYRRLQSAHTLATKQEFAGELRKLLKCNRATVDRTLELSCEAGALEETGTGLQGLGPASMERFIAERVQAMLAGDFERDQMVLRPAPDEAFLTQFFTRYSARHGISLNLEQREAVGMSLTAPISIICGGAGVGKTTVLRAVIEAAEPLGASVLLMALSGRAARRMAEATGREARTIASFLTAVDRGEVLLDGEPIIAVDESSMLDLPTMYRLLRRLEPGCRLLLLGDPGQLPPIGFGLVFHALVDSNMVPTVELTEVHRQAAATGIPQVSRDVRTGTSPDLAPYSGLGVGVSFIECGLPAVADTVRAVMNDLGGFGNVQVISPVKSGPAGTVALNQFFHGLLGFGRPAACGYAEGEPVIWTKNDYDRGLMNGSMGTVRAATAEGPLIDWDEGEMLIDDVTDMSLAYAITAHKGQGSQWERVVVPVFESRLLDRTLLYTAITRAQYQVVLVGDRQAFERAVMAPPSHSQRQTGMRHHLEMAKRKE